MESRPGNATFETSPGHEKHPHEKKGGPRMARSRASAKAAGARFERSIADHLAEHVDDRIDRRVKNGSNDRGDIGGIRHMGARVVVEAKDYGGRYLVGPWLGESELERGNDDAEVGLVVAKRRGTAKPGEQVVFMTVDDLIGLLTGTRPGHGA